MSAHAWRLLIPSSRLIEIAGKGLTVPKGGWNRLQFARQGRLLINALARLAKITQRKAAPVVARKSNEIFRVQLQRVCAIVLRPFQGRSAKADAIGITLGAHENLWAQAIDEVFGSDDLIFELVPPIQSVMGQGFSQTGKLLGTGTRAESSIDILIRAQRIAQKITRINETTRQIIIDIVKDSVQTEATVADTIKRVMEDVPSVNDRRAMTIARTELNNAYTEGAIANMKTCETLTHMSVIGCEAREENQWQWNGESTCNYEDIPIEEIDAFMAVGFHPNHTGTMVPSKFSE